MDRDYYYNTSWQMLETRNFGNADPIKQYVWCLRYIDSPIVRFYDEDIDGPSPIYPDGDYDDPGDSIMYYTTDANFNVTALVRRDTGRVADRYEYAPYGFVTFLNGDPGTAPSPGDKDGTDVTEWADDTFQWSDWENLILFAGYQWDLSGTYYARNRYYHPTLGTWLTRDPSGYGDGANLYQYVRSAPTTGVDPYGLYGRLTYKYRFVAFTKRMVDHRSTIRYDDEGKSVGIDVETIYVWDTYDHTALERKMKYVRKVLKGYGIDASPVNPSMEIEWQRVRVGYSDVNPRSDWESKGIHSYAILDFEDLDEDVERRYLRDHYGSGADDVIAYVPGSVSSTEDSLGFHSSSSHVIGLAGRHGSLLDGTSVSSVTIIHEILHHFLKDTIMPDSNDPAHDVLGIMTPQEIPGEVRVGCYTFLALFNAGLDIREMDVASYMIGMQNYKPDTVNTGFTFTRW